MKKTKMIVQAGLFVAINTIFYLVSRYSGGMLESILIFILPLPLILFTQEYGIKYGVIPFVAITVIGMFINPISTLFYVLTSNILGLVYGDLIRKKVKSVWLVVITVLMSCIIEVLTSVIFAELLGYDINEEIREIYLFFLKIFGFRFDDPILMSKLIKATLPCFILILGFTEGVATHAIASIVLSKMRIREQTLSNMYRIRIPLWVGIIFIVALVGHASTAYFYYVDTYKWLTIISYILLEIFWILALILCVKGFLFLMIKLAYKNRGKIFAILFFIGMVLIPIPMIFILSIVGLVSVFSDKRKYLLYNK